MRLLSLSLTVLLALVSHFTVGAEPSSSPDYGNNPQAGGYVELSGMKMYYERYGSGDPLVLIHGSGQSIEAMHHQIQYFAKSHQVLVADSRGHGKSGLGSGALTYEQMADDWSALMDALNIHSADIMGWSDGGNIGLLLAIHHPDKLKKMAIMGANLQPGEAAVYAWARQWVATESNNIEVMLAKGDKTQNWPRLKQQLGLLREQPNIPLSALRDIQTPVLVMAGDRDIIRTEHTLEMFHNLPNAQLAIFPGETHYAPHNHPQIFNATVGKFFAEPFSMPDTRDLF